MILSLFCSWVSDSWDGQDAKGYRKGDVADIHLYESVIYIYIYIRRDIHLYESVIYIYIYIYMESERYNWKNK